MKPWRQLSNQRRLSEMMAYSIKTQVSLKGLSTSKAAGDQSDFVVSQLAKLIDVPERNKLIVDKWLELSTKGRSLALLYYYLSATHTSPFFAPAENKHSTIVFAANVAHIEHFVEEFQSRGINAVGVHANTPKDERRQITQDFKDKRIPVLVNCGERRLAFQFVFSTAPQLSIFSFFHQGSSRRAWIFRILTVW